MPCALEKMIMSEVSEDVMLSILYAVSNIYSTTEDSRLCKAQMSNRSKDREIELINKEG